MMVQSAGAQSAVAADVDRAQVCPKTRSALLPQFRRFGRLTYSFKLLFLEAALRQISERIAGFLEFTHHRSALQVTGAGSRPLLAVL